MLEVTGVVANKSYDKEVLSAEAVVSMFGVSLDMTAKSVVFSILENKMKDDKRNKFKRHPKLRLTPVVEGTFKGHQVTIRYYERMMRKDKGDPTYTPTRIRHTVIEEEREMANNKELIVWLALSGSCLSSPITTTSIKYYRLMNKEREAEAGLDRESLIATLVVTIRNSKPADIRRWAHSISLTGTSIEGVPYKNQTVRGSIVKQSNTELQRELMRLARLLPEKFDEQIKDQDVILKGTIREAVDAGILRQHNIGSGMTTWAWGEKYNEGIDIVTSRPSQDAYLAIYLHLVKGGNFDYYTSEFNKYLGYSDGKEELANIPKADIQKALSGEVDIKTLNVSELVKLANDQDKLYFDRRENKVFLVNEGEVDEKTFHKVTDAVNWKKDLEEGIEKAAMKKNRLIANLK